MRFRKTLTCLILATGLVSALPYPAFRMVNAEPGAASRPPTLRITRAAFS
jgi:hypothetical protein